MSKSTTDAVKAFKKRLINLPARGPEKLSGKELITRIAPEIREMRRRGYSMQQVSEWISEDFEVALRPDTVMSYLRDLPEQTTSGVRQGVAAN